MPLRYLAAAATAVPGAASPALHGLTSWSYDPALAGASVAVTNGTVYLVRMPNFPAGTAITKLYWHVAVAGVTPTAGQNEVGLYSSAGTKLASTNVDADISSTGTKTTTITSQTPTADPWIGWVFNAATPPSLARVTVGAGGSLWNVGFTAANTRFATNGTVQTVLPSSITPASNSQASSAFWAAVGP